MLRIHISILALVVCVSSSIFSHPGTHGTQRIAPDNQTVPLDIGSVPDIPKDQLVILVARVIDADTGEPIPHRVRITDHQGRYYPPLGHSELGEIEGHVDNATLEPDLVNRGNRTWAMIEEGTFTVYLRAIDGYTLRLAHGLEYDRPEISLQLNGKAGQTIKRIIKLKQGIDMQARGWMSADSHVHSLSPEGALRQMKVEDVDYTNLMFIGPKHPLFTRGFVTGIPHPVSTKDRIVYVSQEVRDMNQGHMTLMGMSDPIEPILVYTGTGKTEIVPLPNEPLNWQVTQRMHDQGGLAFHAHYLFWPGHGSAVGGALSLLDGLEWTSTDIVNNRRRTRQGFSIPGYETNPTGADSGKLYYRMLNCGVRLPLIGGTDKMSAARPIGSVARTYAKVKEWTHDGLLTAIRDGNTFVTNGPLLALTANNQPIGSDLQFTGSGSFTIDVHAECFSQRPVNFIQLIQDGQVVTEMRGDDVQQQTNVIHQLSFNRSGWIALRAGHDTPDPEDWWGYTMAAHTSPIYVTINNEPPANAAYSPTA
ncbi:MAG: CehA/McbA family metallohydrolase, partial [Verrucomicrobia bacterium]|nr:CehA/McbA family metallohydrolase [Verrucomicrobiota bacterium]